VIALSGCGEAGDGLPRQGVTGTVTLDGRPLERGIIRLESTSMMAGGEISGGRFDIPRAQGPIPGDYRVFISSTPPASSAEQLAPPGESTSPPPDPIPARYNSASTLSAKVESGGANSFEFALKTR
jgi:hypothetical protein